MTNSFLLKSLLITLPAWLWALGPRLALAAEKTAKAKPISLGEAANYLMNTIHEVWLGFVGHLPYIAAGLLVLLCTWGASYVVAGIIHRFTRQSHMRKSLVELTERMTRLVVWALGLLLAAMVVFPGLTPTKALGGLGIASIAVGLAFRDIFENFFSGILILWRYPFENGDYISYARAFRDGWWRPRCATPASSSSPAN